MPCMCCIIFGICHKHNSLDLGPIQSSSPSTKELHGQGGEQQDRPRRTLDGTDQK